MTAAKPTIAYPVIYGHDQVVAGADFVAAVTINGRALLREDEDGVTCSAIQPAGFVGCGHDRYRAFAEFKEELRVALLDLAEESSGYVAFRDATLRFFDGPNGSLERHWQDAVEAVKSGKTRVTWATTVSNYPKREARIARLSEVTSQAEPEPRLLALAA